MSKLPLKLPFQKPNFLDTLGIEVYEMKNGESKLSMPFDKKFLQPYGMVHGGVIFSLADSACGFAVASIVKFEKKFVTAEMKINYLEPVTENELVCFGKVLREGRVIPVEAEVYNKNILVAKAIATYIILD